MTEQGAPTPPFDPTKLAPKPERWGKTGYKKRRDGHDECPHPVKGSHDPAVEQCCMCGKQTAVKSA